MSPDASFMLCRNFFLRSSPYFWDQVLTHYCFGNAAAVVMSSTPSTYHHMKKPELQLLLRKTEKPRSIAVAEVSIVCVFYMHGRSDFLLSKSSLFIVNHKIVATFSIGSYQKDPFGALLDRKMTPSQRPNLLSGLASCFARYLQVFPDFLSIFGNIQHIVPLVG